jgi:hypothetical protein
LVMPLFRLALALALPCGSLCFTYALAERLVRRPNRAKPVVKAS